MKTLKHIRIVVALVMLFECTLWVVAGHSAAAHSRVAASLQLSPSLVAAGVGATVGAGVLWLVLTFLLGRVYCSAFCPLGIVQDIVIRIRGTVKPYRFRYKKSSPKRLVMLGVYIASLVAAIGCIPLLLEPWPVFVNILNHGLGEGVHPSLNGLGVGALLGIVCALLSAAGVLVYALVSGRDFCNDVCPIGTALRVVGAHSLMHIELNPDKCDSCLKCEDVCKASCIDIKSRTIDNGRCVRCFNCVAVCPHGAIKYTPDRNGVATFLGVRAKVNAP